MSKKESRFSKVGNLAKSLRGGLKRGMSADAVTDKITSVVGRKYKKDTLNNNARRLRKLIPVAGEGIIRSEFLKGTRKDIRNCIKEGKTDKEILASCYEAPEYLLLLKDLQMDMDFIAYMVKDIRENPHKKADTTVQHSEQNAPKRYDCPKCGKNSKRVKVEDGKAFYFCSNHKGFSVNL